MEAEETHAPPNGRKLGGTHENCRRLYGWNVHRLSSIALWKPSCVQPEPAELSEVLTASSDAPPAQGERTDVMGFHAARTPSLGVLNRADAPPKSMVSNGTSTRYPDRTIGAHTR